MLAAPDLTAVTRRKLPWHTRFRFTTVTRPGDGIVDGQKSGQDRRWSSTISDDQGDGRLGVLHSLMPGACARILQCKKGSLLSTMEEAEVLFHLGFRLQRVPSG